MFEFYVVVTLLFTFISILFFVYSFIYKKGKLKGFVKPYETISTVILIVSIILLLYFNEARVFSLMLAISSTMVLLLKRAFMQIKYNANDGKDYAKFEFWFIFMEAMIFQGVSAIILMNAILKFLI